MSASVDVLVVGAGHNGLVAATFLARAGLKVTVYEEQSTIGGACKTEWTFARSLDLPMSTGAYLFGLMPPELVAKLDIEIPTVRRDPHYFLPTTGKRYLLLGSDRESVKRQFCSFFSERDWRANDALQTELAQIREDVATTWLQEPRTIQETAERHVRPSLRDVFVNLCRKSVGDYLARFDFESDLLRAMYATTDGFSGLDGTWDTPGTGMNFLVHNMCRLPGSDATFMVVRGGMGTVTARIGDAARKAGATIETGRRVARIVVERGGVRGAALSDGSEIRSNVVVCNADPFRMRALVGAHAFPPDYVRRIDSYFRPGTTMKVNLALRGLPTFSCLEDFRVYGPTIHLLPEDDVIASLRRAYAEAKAGILPDQPTIEWYFHSTLDPSMTNARGHHGSALFVQWVPYALSGDKSWDQEEEHYVRHLLSICDRFAPGTSDLVVDTFTLTPPKIERHFGITGGHIHHVDNSFGFADRLPYATPVTGLYSASAGTHPAGSVIGCAGHNAAMRVLKDLGLPPS